MLSRFASSTTFLEQFVDRDSGLGFGGHWGWLHYAPRIDLAHVAILSSCFISVRV